MADVVGGFKVRVQGDLHAMLLEAGLPDGQALVEEALTLYEWAVGATRDGKVVAAFDERTREREVVSMGSLRRVAERRRRPDLRVVAGTDAPGGAAGGGTVVTVAEVAALVRDFVRASCNPIEHAASAAVEVYLDAAEDAGPGRLRLALSNGQSFVVKVEPEGT